MAVFLVCLVLFLAMTGHSSAIYCVCRDGVADSALQRNIDYACGAGADCSPILQNGVCYNPNTVKAHCDWAVNSYYQRRGQTGATCDFSGTATTSQNPPSGQTSTCVYPSSASPAGPGTNPAGPGTNPIAPPSGSTGTPSTPGSTVPGANTPGSTVPGTNTPGATVPGTNTPIFGLGPTGSGITNTDNNSANLNLHQSINLFYSFTLTLVLSGFIRLRV